jgi:hypothetical protein
MEKEELDMGEDYCNIACYNLYGETEENLETLQPGDSE